MATNVARIQAELDLDSGKFHGSITSAIGQLKTFNASVTNTDKSLKNIERRVTGLGASLRDTMVVLGQFRAAMHTLWTFTGQWIGAIVQANAKLERLQQLMKGLSRSTTEAGKVADSLRDMNYVLEQAKHAPFTVDAIGDAFVKLKTSGIDPTRGAMKALMDGIAQFGGSSEQLHRATIAIQQMAGKGVVSMEELRQQLGEAIPNAMQLMARAAGMSMGELVKTISLGRLAFNRELQDKFFGEMQRQFAGASENMMGTWVGLTQRLKTEWMLFAKEIGGRGLFQTVKAAALELITLMSSGEGKAFARDIGRAIGDAAKAAVELVRFLIQNRDEIMTWGKLLAQIFIVKKLTDFSFALISTGANIVNMTRSLGGLGTAMAAARAGTITWSAAIGAAAGPIGIAITAIASLIMYLNNQYQAAIRAGDAMQDYYNRTANGQAVSPEEHAGMKMRLDYLRRVEQAVQQANKRPKGNQYAREAANNSLDKLLAEGREMGFVQDAGNGLADAFTTLESKTVFLAKMYSANVGKAMTDVSRQESIQQAARVETMVREYGDKIAATASKVAPEVNTKLEAAWKLLDSGKIKKAEYQAMRTDILGGALDAKIASLEAARSSLADQYVNLQHDEGAAKNVAKLMEETNRQLQDARAERAGIGSEVTLMPKMGAGGKEKQQVDEYKNLFTQLQGKAAELQAQLDGGVPKLEKFRELVAEGHFEGNKGLIGGIEALYKSLDALEKKVKEQKATEKLKDDLTDMEAKAKADVISANVAASGDIYNQVAAGMVGFNRQIEVMRAHLDETKMGRAEFEEWVKRIKGHIAAVDFINFQKFAADTVWENYLATLPEKARNVEEFNKRLREYAILRQQLIAENPDQAQEINDTVDEMIASDTKRLHHANRTEWQKWIDDYKDISEEMEGVWANAMDGMVDKMVEFVMTGKASFSDLIKSILAQIVKLLISQAVAKLVELMMTAFGSAGYADGGVHGPDGPVATAHAKGGVFGSSGSVPLRKYARGGIATNPQLALFGEGDLPEAYVPLPDGRTIPVTMDGGGGGGTSVVNSVSIQVNIAQDGSAESDSKSNTKAGQELGKVLDMKVKQALTDEMRPGGILWGMAHG